MGSIPSEIFNQFPDLHALKISRTSLHSLKESDFEGASKLQILSIRDAKIQNLTKNVFYKIDSLEILSLTHNDIKNISAKAFRLNKKLKFIDLASNSLTSLHKNTFKGLVDLEEVFLCKNKLKSILDNIFASNSKLRRVSFLQNKLTLFDMTIFENKNLTYADFKSCDCIDVYFDEESSDITRTKTDLKAPTVSETLVKFNKADHCQIIQGGGIIMEKLIIFAVICSLLGVTVEYFDSLTHRLIKFHYKFISGIGTLCPKNCTFKE